MRLIFTKKKYFFPPFTYENTYVHFNNSKLFTGIYKSVRINSNYRIETNNDIYVPIFKKIIKYASYYLPIKMFIFDEKMKIFSIKLGRSLIIF